MPRARLSLLLPLLGLSVLLSVAADASAARIDAVKGREYKLTKQHGPWMIMVASFRPASPDGIVRNGKTPLELAQDLVYELRQNRLPAYVYRMDAPDAHVETTDRLGREETRKLLTSYDQVCVIAGNYPSLEDKTAQDTLKWMKKFRPKALQQEGVSWLETQRRKGPLGGAFLTVNPLLSLEEIAQRRHDPLLLKINGGNRYSLYNNKGTYTLVVATFAGKTLAHLGDSNSPEAHKAFHVRSDTSKGGSDGFGRIWKKTEENDLDAGSRSAWELAVALRELSANIDAYVWHERYRSVVTVGSFESPNDPKIKRYLRVFAAQPGADSQQVAGTLQSILGPSSTYFGMSAGGTGVKFLTIDFAGKKSDEHRMWLFDPEPLLMRVPQMR